MPGGRIQGGRRRAVIACDNGGSRGLKVPWFSRLRLAIPQIGDISNLDEDNKVRELDDRRRQAIAPLIVEHDVFWSRGQIGFTEFPPGERDQYLPSPQRLVRLHPGSKRKTLYLSAHASHVIGWPVADGRLLLWDLTAHATQRQFVYSHSWRIGDLVIWDNRCTMHRGRPHDEAQPRDLRRATTLDSASALDQAA